MTETTTTSPTTTTTSATTTTPTETTPPEPELPEMTGPIKIMESFDAPGSVLAVMTGGRYAAVQTIDVDENNDSLTAFYLVDVVSDELVASHLADEVKYSEFLLGVRSDGTIVTSDFADEQLKFYPLDGEAYTMKYPKETVSIAMDTKGELYSFYRDIERISETGEKTTLFHREDISNLQFADFDRDIVVAGLLAESLSHESEFCAISLESGKVLYTVDEPSEAQVSYAGDKMVFSRPNYDERDSHTLSVYDLKTGKPEGCYIDDPDDDVYTFSSGGYGMTYRVKDEDKPFGLKLLDISSGRTAVLEPDVENASWCMFKAFGATGLFVCAIDSIHNEDEDVSAHIKLAVIDPAQADYTGSLKEGSAYTSPAEQHHLIGEQLGEARSMADSLEEKYGIDILVGDEILDLEKIDASSIPVSIEKDFYPYRLEELMEALDMLDEALALYPEGFFERFKKERGGGLIIGISSELENAMGGGFSAAGITCRFGLWDIICLNTTALKYDLGAIHHELWHAVEDRISLDTPLSEEDWLKLCPECFEYFWDFEGYNDGNVSNADTFFQSDDPFFITTYSKVTPMEDRATLIEDLFLSGMNDDTDFFEKLESSTHLQAKYDFLADWSKSFFGYVYWEKIPYIAEYWSSAA